MQSFHRVVLTAPDPLRESRQLDRQMRPHYVWGIHLVSRLQRVGERGSKHALFPFTERDGDTELFQVLF